MTIQQEILIRVLALTDMCWLPFRRWQEPRLVGLAVEMRSDYSAGGVQVDALAGSGADAAARARAAKAVAGLVTAGMLEVCRPRFARSTALRLTDRGDEAARGMADLPGLGASGELMPRLGMLTAEPISRDLGALVYNGGEAVPTAMRMCSEYVVAGVRMREGPLTARAKRWLQTLEDCWLPALCRQYVVTNSTSEGFVHYGITDAGQKWFESGCPVQKSSRKVRGAEDLYDQALADALNGRSTRSPRHPQEIGDWYLPGSGGEPDGHDEASQEYRDGRHWAVDEPVEPEDEKREAKR